MILSLLAIFLLTISPSYGEQSLKTKNQDQEVGRGPLKMSADETVSFNHGQIIEAKGNVKVRYFMENGDTLRSVSKFARYDHSKGVGEIWGAPDALWTQKDPSQPTTRLLADKIILKPKNSELQAIGHVSVIQTSSTLLADHVSYSNELKKITAKGEKPEFIIRQAGHHTRISAREITAYTEKRDILFSEKVRGTVLLLGP